jgi:hypothetical protein
MTEQTEPTDKDLDKDLDTLADKLYKRIKQKQQEEKDQNEERKKVADPDAKPPSGGTAEPYAVCAGCSRILTRSNYENSSCPYCGSTKAIIINHANYTTNQ